MQSTTTLAADAAVIALRNAMQSAALYAGRCDSDEDAAHLLLTALTPLVERDDDAAITLPAAALQRLLEGLVNALYGQRASMRGLHHAASNLLKEVQP